MCKKHLRIFHWCTYTSDWIEWTVKWNLGSFLIQTRITRLEVIKSQWDPGIEASRPNQHISLITTWVRPLLIRWHDLEWRRLATQRKLTFEYTHVLLFVEWNLRLIFFCQDRVPECKIQSQKSRFFAPLWSLPMKIFLVSFTSETFVQGTKRNARQRLRKSCVARTSWRRSLKQWQILWRIVFAAQHEIYSFFSSR